MSKDWDLARRATSCRHWRWMPGMAAVVEDSSAIRYLGDAAWYDAEAQEIYASSPVDPLPDLTDHATLGCVMNLVWEAWFSAIYLEPQVGGGWLAIEPNGHVIWREPASYAETLVVALEKAL